MRLCVDSVCCCGLCILQSGATAQSLGLSVIGNPTGSPSLFLQHSASTPSLRTAAMSPLRAVSVSESGGSPSLMGGPTALSSLSSGIIRKQRLTGSAGPVCDGANAVGPVERRILAGRRAASAKAWLTVHSCGHLCELKLLFHLVTSVSLEFIPSYPCCCQCITSPCRCLCFMCA